MWKLRDERSLLKMRVLSRAVKGATANAALQLEDIASKGVTPHTVVLTKTRKMHIKNYKHLAAAFYMVIHMQKEFKLYLSIQLRSGHFGIISNLAP